MQHAHTIDSRQTTNVTLIRFITSLTVDYCFHDNRYQVNVLNRREVLLQFGVVYFCELLVPGSFFRIIQTSVKN